MHPNDWCWEDCGGYTAVGGAHANDSGFNADPTVIRSRPIGFCTNIDVKPVVRLRARGRRCSIATLCSSVV